MWIIRPRHRGSVRQREHQILGDDRSAPGAHGADGGEGALADLPEAGLLLGAVGEARGLQQGEPRAGFQSPPLQLQAVGTGRVLELH